VSVPCKVVRLLEDASLSCRFPLTWLFFSRVTLFCQSPDRSSCYAPPALTSDHGAGGPAMPDGTRNGGRGCPHIPQEEGVAGKA